MTINKLILNLKFFPRVKTLGCCNTALSEPDESSFPKIKTQYNTLKNKCFKNFLTWVLFTICLLQVANAVSATTINNLRLIEADNKVSIVFDANKSFNYFLEQSPDKILVAIKNAKLTALLNKTWLTKTPIASINSKQIGKTLHLTLKLKNPVKLKYDQLKKPARLMLDFAVVNTKAAIKKNNNHSPDTISEEARKTESNELVPQDESTTQAVITNEEKIDLIEEQIAVQIANNKESITSLNATILNSASKPERDKPKAQYQDEDAKIKLQDNEIKIKSQNDSAPVSQEITSNNPQEFIADTVNIINTGSNANSNKSRDIIIVIDPGHGGEDPGAIGFSGTQEKDINLAVSKYLQKTINANKGFKAVLTRSSDYFIQLRERLDIAHRYKADMFVAIHADAYISKTARGASIFALSQKGATSEAARWLAKKENESELGRNISNKNVSLKSVLIDLAQASTISVSLEIGQSLLDSFKQFAHLHSHRVEQAALVVLKSPDIPSLLVETGFISDPYEESRLRDPKYQQKIAFCLASGVIEHFTNRPPRGTYLAKLKR